MQSDRRVLGSTAISRFAHPQHSTLKALELNSGLKLACSHKEVSVKILYFRKYHYSQIISTRKCLDRSHFPSLSGPRQPESDTKFLKLVCACEKTADSRSCKPHAMSSVDEYRLGGKKLPVSKVELGGSDTYETTTNKYFLNLAGGRNSLDIDETSNAIPPSPQLWTRMRKHASRLSRPTEDTNWKILFKCVLLNCISMFVLPFFSIKPKQPRPSRSSLAL